MDYYVIFFVIGMLLGLMTGFTVGIVHKKEHIVGTLHIFEGSMYVEIDSVEKYDEMNNQKVVSLRIRK